MLAEAASTESLIAIVATVAAALGALGTAVKYLADRLAGAIRHHSEVIRVPLNALMSSLDANTKAVNEHTRGLGVKVTEKIRKPSVPALRKVHGGVR